MRTGIKKSFPLSLKVSIIIVCHNGKNWLKRLFDSIKRQTYKNIELILVDNNSVDQSVSLAKRIYPKLLVLKSKRNLGWGAGVNFGAKKATGEFLMFLNEDMWLDEHLVENLVEFYKRNSDKVRIGAVDTRQLAYDCSGEPKRGNALDLLLNPQPNYAPVSSLRPAFFFSAGAPNFMPRKVFDEVGGYDKEIFLYYEDVDLSWRLRLAGYQIAFCEDGVLYHHVGGVVKPSIQLELSKRRNSQYLMLKNYSLRSLLFVAIFYALHIRSLWFFSRRFHKDQKLPIEVELELRSAFRLPWIFKELRMVLRKRDSTQRLRKISDKEIIRSISKSFLDVQCRRANISHARLAGVYQFLYNHLV